MEHGLELSHLGVRKLATDMSSPIHQWSMAALLIFWYVWSPLHVYGTKERIWMDINCVCYKHKSDCVTLCLKT